MAATKVVLRTALPGDTFWAGDTEVTHEGVEFSSKQAAADMVAMAAEAGVQLYVMNPADQTEADDERTEAALLASGLLDSEPEPKSKPPAQNQGGAQGGNG